MIYLQWLNAQKDEACHSILNLKVSNLSGLFLVCFDIWTKSSSRSSGRFKFCLYSFPTSSTRSSKLIGVTRSDASIPMYFKIIWNNFVARLTKSTFNLSNDVGIGSCKKVWVFALHTTHSSRKLVFDWMSITFWKLNISSNVTFSRTWGPTDLLEKNPRFPADWICFCINFKNPSTYDKHQKQKHGYIKCSRTKAKTINHQ